jgi:hypothetical protein
MMKSRVTVDVVTGDANEFGLLYYTPLTSGSMSNGKNLHQPHL